SGVDPRIALRVLCDALAGLHSAHELRDAEGRPADVVHRDFSPQNILVGKDGLGRLTDFGIAKARMRVGETAVGVVKGKLGYLSPEHARGKPLDRRADVWSAGVLAWEILARRRLYEAPNEAAMLLAILEETPPSLRSIDPSIPPE